LHKDVLDEIVLVKDGKKYRRVPEVLDCWFESGAMTFAQFHYPFENKELFEKSFPSQFVAEYIGQVRAWFYYMLVLSAILFEDLPFENVVTTGTILAEDGTKMSKSKNNFSDPMELIGRYGVDALRLYLMGSPVMNADNINFSDKGVEESYKKVILILYNTLRFYDMYKGKEKIKKIDSKNLTDKWIISRLNNFGKVVEESLNNYNTVKACSEIREFVEDLSTWYVRINRERFSEDKNARMTLGYVLNEFSKIVAPIIPFVSEKIYQSLNGNKKSVHLEDYPSFKKEKIDESVLEEMKIVREIVSMGLRVRDKEQIGLKWPLGYGKIKVKNKKNFAKYKELVMQELNVKKVDFIEEERVEVEIDTRITKELESEGYAREISRIVQAFRKDLGLQKKDKINLLMECDEELKDILSREKDFISERTNAKKFDIVTTSKERFKNSIDFSVKGKKGVIGIQLLKK
jgi:isoleucyl-tRNA synthetase